MESILLTTEFVLTALITIAVLLQKSSSIGLGAYSSSNETVFGAEGPAAFLAKATFFLGILFVANTLSLSYVYSEKSSSSIMDNANIKVPVTKKHSPVPPSVPTAPAQK